MDENATISLGAVGIVGSFISMLIWVFGQTIIVSVIDNIGSAIPEIKAGIASF